MKLRWKLEEDGECWFVFTGNPRIEDHVIDTWWHVGHNIRKFFANL